ncbi:hypothetical protein B0T25DRAFT_484388 [Lasiosphaeria hispida]|uniref:Hydantoinase n=1 Tax=Lasiosphaeria hispida TaxID=260671 RepID=A0AAJ0HBV8_9PEZI|nr:hypothetical protein B0T25DRAFT_484388 [Lasiosphaeria hispida]
MSRSLRIGIDVGGTNTDGAILDPSRSSDPGRGILAWTKTPTTPNPSQGIASAISALLAQVPANENANGGDGISLANIASVTIGTTHFVNAMVERDARHLSRVAVIRLCGQFSKHIPPCVDWPDDMRSLVLGYHARVRGGLEVDGTPIADIDEAEIREQCKEIRKRGITSIVINGIFSPIDITEKQEEGAARIAKDEIPGCHVVCSKDVATLGFLERENAAILNASVLRFARKTIKALEEAVRVLGLACPTFITQNDGTILSVQAAAALPIRTFSSGPTNSMRGAGFLRELDQPGKGSVLGSGPVVVVDIGGTTTDVGLLLKNGFPRQQMLYSELSGIRTNFSHPDIKSIGLGGGSIVRKNPLRVGPDSVGYMLTEKALVFGGDILTATDCAVLLNPDLSIGNRALAVGAVTDEELEQFKAIVKRKLEGIINIVKTSPGDLPVILVGGGSVIAPDMLEGASSVWKPRQSGVANAIGAAIARTSAIVDTIRSTETKTSQEILDAVTQEAIEKTIATGAASGSVEVAEKEVIPVQYVANISRFIVRAVGDFDFARTTETSTSSQAGYLGTTEADDVEQPRELVTEEPAPLHVPEPPCVDVHTYKPDVRRRVWYISETDLSWISTGCYILGTGGGGSPYPQMLLLRQLLRSGAAIRVVNPRDVPDTATVGSGCGVGSPTVSVEKLQGDEMMEAQRALYQICEQQPTHMISIEIGGLNGLQGMTLGCNMDLPCVDGDWMGRAYPTKWQTTPVVFNERQPIWSPVALSDGNGNVVSITSASSDLQVERLIRAVLGPLGSLAACADPPVAGAEMKRWVVEHTLSQSWRIGRAVAKAKASNRLDDVAEAIIDECGGPQAGGVIFKGKIVSVNRTLRMGHVYGECIIEAAVLPRGDEGDEVSHESAESGFRGRIKIPFKNENIAAIRIPGGSKTGDNEPEEQENVLAIVPDLIAVIDAQTGEAIGTPEYRYGQLVSVLGLAASRKWTESSRGIQLGGPEAFGLGHLEFKPIRNFALPISVIDEFDDLVE